MKKHVTFMTSTLSMTSARRLRFCALPTFLLYINDHFAKILYNICITTLEYYSPRIMREKTPFNLLTWLVSILKNTVNFSRVRTAITHVQNRSKVQFIFSSLILKELEFFYIFLVSFSTAIDSIGSEWDWSVSERWNWN